MAVHPVPVELESDRSQQACAHEKERVPQSALLAETLAGHAAQILALQRSAGNRAVGRMLGRARLQRASEKELVDLAYADALANSQLERDIAKGEAERDLPKNKVKEAHELGVDIDRIVRRPNGDAQLNALDAAIKEIRDKLAAGEGGWQGLGSTPEIRTEVFKALITEGHTETDIIATAKDLASKSDVPAEAAPRVETFKKAMREGFTAPVKSLTGADYSPKGYQVSGVEDVVIKSAERARQAGHTLDVNAYVERHFTRELMTFLIAHPEVSIEIYEGRTGNALGELAGRGYTQIRPLSDNAVTDFTKFMARKPDGIAALVVVGDSGAAYQREIAAHFVYYNSEHPDRRIEPGRIRHHRLGADATKDEFHKTLQGLKADPDIVVMGNVEQLKRMLNEQATIAPIDQVIAENLFGWLYSINGKVVMSLKVEPDLYADRAGAFVQALNGLSSKRRTVIFTGTAGALDKANMKVGDIVAPTVFQRSDTLTSTPVESLKNKAITLLEEMARTIGSEGIHTGSKVMHGAVDTILFEDKEWFATHQKRGLTIVEQEVAGLAAAVAASMDQTELYAFFRISDILGVQDFTKNETDRPEARTKFYQGNVILTALEQVVGPLPRDVPKPEPRATKKGRIQQHEVAYETESSTVFLVKSQLDALNSVEPKMAKQLEDRLPALIATHQKSSSDDVIKAIVELYGEYGMLAKPRAEARVVKAKTIDIKVLHKDAVALQIRLGDAGEPRPAMKLGKSADLWAVSYDQVPEGQTVQASLDGKQWKTVGQYKASEGKPFSFPKELV